MDIWQSASGSNEYKTTGWLGRYLDEQCGDCDKPTQALEIDDTLSLALKEITLKDWHLKIRKDYMEPQWIRSSINYRNNIP